MMMNEAKPLRLRVQYESALNRCLNFPDALLYTRGPGVGVHAGAHAHLEISELIFQAEVKLVKLSPFVWV